MATGIRLAARDGMTPSSPSSSRAPARQRERKTLRIAVRPPTNLTLEAARAALERLMPLDEARWQIEGRRLAAYVPVAEAISVAVRLTEHQAVHLAPVFPEGDPAPSSSPPLVVDGEQPEFVVRRARNPIFLGDAEDDDEP